MTDSLAWHKHLIHRPCTRSWDPIHNTQLAKHYESFESSPVSMSAVLWASSDLWMWQAFAQNALTSNVPTTQSRWSKKDLAKSEGWVLAAMGVPYDYRGNGTVMRREDTPGLLVRGVSVEGSSIFWEVVRCGDLLAH
jgi:hypothetical protein